MDSGIPDSILRLLDDVSLNPFILQVFLSGLYTLLFAQGLWRLCQKKSNKLYTMALIFLWIAATMHMSFQWARIRDAFIDHNFSPVETTLALGSRNDAIIILGSLCTIIANGILVWRCSVLWNGHIWVIQLGLGVLFVGTTGTTLWNIVNSTGANGSPLPATISEFLATVTTFSATALIALRIILVTRISPTRSSYRRIILILIESAALYTAVSMIIGILALIDTIKPFDVGTTGGLVAFQISQYATAVETPITGIAPTLIAFRVAEEKPQTEVNGTNPLSHLTFRRSRPSALSGQLSTLRFGRDPPEGRVNTEKTESHDDKDLETA